MSDRMLGRLTARTIHLCVDMQLLFSSAGPWATPWMDRVLPLVAAIAARHPERTVFTRFIPPRRPEEMPGMWRRYYERWREVTREHLDPALLELMPALAAMAPPAEVVDKRGYSAFAVPALVELLQRRDADGLILTGTETDVCVLATALGAVDHGYRVAIVEDAVCSSSDECHDALLTVYRQRFTEQIDILRTEDVLRRWEK